MNIYTHRLFNQNNLFINSRHQLSKLPIPLYLEQTSQVEMMVSQFTNKKPVETISVNGKPHKLLNDH